jgi:membrane-bound ClpP family serine protease
VPKSKVRKKTVYTPPAEVRPTGRKRGPSPQAVPIVAVGLMVLGIVWLIIYYFSQGNLPIKPIGAYNLGVGFAMLVAALAVLTQWR